MNYLNTEGFPTAKKKKKPARPNLYADLQGAEAPRSLIKPVASQPGASYAGLQGAEAPSKSRDMTSLPDFSQINGLPPLPGTSAVTSGQRQFTPEQIAEARREVDRIRESGEHSIYSGGGQPFQGGIQPEYSNLVELEAHPAAEPAAQAVNYADIELAELKQSLQPKPVTAKGVDTGVDLAAQAPGTSPGAPVSVAPTPVVTPTTDVIPAGVRELEQTQDFVPVDPNAAAAEAERKRDEYAAVEEAEAERERAAEAERERERQRDEDFTIEHQRLEAIRAGNREQDIARARQEQRYAEAGRKTDQQRLEDMEQEQLRTELSDAQQKLADVMGAVPEATTAPAAGPSPGLTDLEETLVGQPETPAGLAELEETLDIPTVSTDTTVPPESVSPEITAAGGYTDRELREQQMQEQHRILTASEALAAERAGGLERERPELLATGDVSYDPEYFGYEGDLQEVILNALRQNLTGAGGMDMRTASQIADLEDRQRKDETQTMEELNRLGILRGGGDTADVLGELRAGYGRTYADIMGAAQGRSDPQLEAAMNLARMASDRYMTGGEMIGRLGGQDTLEARLAQQAALERGEDLQRGDVMLEQDIADRALARGMTLTEPTTRERFEEGVRGAQEAESLARGGMTGYLGGQATIERERMLDLERERDQAIALEQAEMRELERELAAGQVSLEGEEGRVETIAGQEAGAEERMHTERVNADKSMLNRELGNRVTMGQIDRSKAKDVQKLINDGRVKEAAALLDVRQAELKSAERMQTERADLEREVAAGEVTIDDRQVKTLEAGKLELEQDLTNAQLQTLYRTEQGQSIANMLALMNTLPENSDARKDLAEKIGKAVEVGIANDALAGTIRDMLTVDEADFVRQPEDGAEGEGAGTEFPPDTVKTPVGTRKYDTEDDWLADNPQPKGYDKRGGGGNPGKEPTKILKGTGRWAHAPRTNPDWIKWNRRATEFAAWDRRRQEFLDNVLEEPGQDVDTSTTDETAAGDTGQTGILDLDPENNETSDQEAQDDAAVNDGTAEEAEQGTGTPKQNRQALKIKITTDLNADIKQSWRRPGSDTFVVLLSDGTYVIGNSTTGDYSQAESKADAKEQTGMGLKR